MLLTAATLRQPIFQASLTAMTVAISEASLQADSKTFSASGVKKQTHYLKV